jgi:hypothetical protein
VWRVLIVAHQTVGTAALGEAVRTCMAAGPCRFVLLVPAAERQDLESVAAMAIATEIRAVTGQFTTPGLKGTSTPDPFAVARDRLRGGLVWLRHLGATAEGEVGDRNPMRASRACVQWKGREFDEIVISTLPTHLSRWLRMDLPRRVKHEFDLPVTVVTARPVAAQRH